MGADAIFALLQKIDLDALYYDLKDKANNETSKQRKNNAAYCGSKKTCGVGVPRA